MSSEYVVALIGIAGTLLGTIAGALITFFIERQKEKARVRAELRSALNEVAFSQVRNDLPILLNKVRVLVVRNADDFVKNEEMTIFFRKWLNQPALAFNKRIANFLDDERVDEMLNDLEKIKI